MTTLHSWQAVESDPISDSYPVRLGNAAIKKLLELQAPVPGACEIVEDIDLGTEKYEGLALTWHGTWDELCHQL